MGYTHATTHRLLIRNHSVRSWYSEPVLAGVIPCFAACCCHAVVVLAFDACHPLLRKAYSKHLVKCCPYLAGVIATVQDAPCLEAAYLPVFWELF